MEWEEAKRYFKRPIVRATSKSVTTSTTAKVVVLEQNFFRKRAIVGGGTAALISEKGGPIEAAKAFQLGSVVPSQVLYTQEVVYGYDGTGASTIYVWEEYWAEGADVP